MIVGVTTHRSGFAAVALAGLCLGCAALIVLIAADQPVRPENTDLLARGVTSGVAYGVLGGAVALSTPRLVVGWLMLVIGVANAVSALCLALVDVALRADPGSLEVSLSYWLASWIWVPGYVLVPTVLLLVLPNGRPPSPRWRGVLVGAYAVVTVASLVWAVTPYDEQDLPVPAQYAHLRNPVGIEGIGPLLPVALLTVVMVAVLAVVSLFVRAHRAHGREREQVGWVLAGRGYRAAAVRGRAAAARGLRRGRRDGPSGATGRDRLGHPARQALGHRHGARSAAGHRRARRRRDAGLRRRHEADRKPRRWTSDPAAGRASPSARSRRFAGTCSGR